MLENTDPEKVGFQLDIYWIYKGGKDPFAYIEKYPGRFMSFHLKDEKELGESGTIDFISLVKEAKKAGVKYHVVEVEKYNYEPLVSVEKSLEHLKEIGYIKEIKIIPSKSGHLQVIAFLVHGESVICSTVNFIRKQIEPCKIY